MPRGAKKSEHNACPVCGLPRGKGPYEYAHGKCAEQRATDMDVKDKTTSSGMPGDLARISVASAKKGRDNSTRKRYKSGKLPSWMLD